VRHCDVAHYGEENAHRLRIVRPQRKLEVVGPDRSSLDAVSLLLATLLAYTDQETNSHRPASPIPRFSLSSYNIILNLSFDVIGRLV
jgi:hypothetical protein